MGLLPPDDPALRRNIRQPANVRRFLNQGQRPPKDAVRVEELINYFPFNYPEPRDGQPLAVTTAIGDCPWNPNHRPALIGVQARRTDARRPTRNASRRGRE